MLWTLPRQLFAGFGALFGVVVLLLGGFEYVLRSFKSEVDVITQDNIPGLMLSAEALQHALEYRVLTLRHLLSKDAEEWKSISEACDKLAAQTGENLASYEKTTTTAEDRAIFAKVQPALERYRAIAKRMRELNAGGDHAGAMALIPEAGAAFADYEQTVVELTDFNRKFAKKNADAFVATMRQAHLMEFIFGGAAVAVALGAGIFISRRITRSISGVAATLAEGSTQIAGAAAQMSGASQVLAEGSSEQAASLEEASASLEEMAAMTKRNADSAQSAKELSGLTRKSADEGANHMDEMRRAMDAIKASSDDIAKIIKTIDEIAFQTNILALNAAVEAARAGEAGLGFAVVAEEVRNLAQRSAQSAKDTAAKIEDAIRRSEHGVTISASVAHSLSDIVEKARKVDTLVAEIAQASKEQSQGITQLNTTVSEMDRVTQSSAGTAEETAAAAEELSAQAITLRESVAFLENLVGTAKATTVASHARESDTAREEIALPPPETSKARVTRGEARRLEVSANA